MGSGVKGLLPRPVPVRWLPMPRRPRVSTGGVVYHVLNRAAGRGTLFRKGEDYAAFEDRRKIRGRELSSNSSRPRIFRRPVTFVSFPARVKPRSLLQVGRATSTEVL